MIAGLQSSGTNQRRWLGCAMLLLALFLAYYFGVRPLQTEQRMQSQRVAELKVRIAEAELAAARMPLMRAERDVLRNALDVATNRFVLRPLLGSYPAQRTIHRLAGQSSFSVESVREQGVQPTPRQTLTKNSDKRRAAKKATAKTEPAFFARYAVDVSGEGSYVDLLDLIERLEQENPYMGVLSLNVRAEATSPERHRIKMRLEWPVDAASPASK